MPKVCPRCSEPFAEEAAFCPVDGAELERSSDRFLGKTIASRYRLTKRLGSGGMSVVYLARHELISRLSAIKILRPELSRLPEHRERFLREARAVNRINHENIVEITDVGESDGVAYLVMEYVEGHSLLTEIQKGPMPWERALRIGIQVSSALARTHQMGVIHRDLKPENILLVPRRAERAGASPEADAEGLPEIVKLTDFGIAKMMGEPTLTLKEQLFGTPGYIAPEYVGGLSIDGRADIYSLAVVLYEMVTGQLPFEGRGQSDLLLKPLTTAPIAPSRRVGGLPRDLESLLLRALAREPDSRPHDAFALQDALADILRRYSGRPAGHAPAGGGVTAPVAGATTPAVEAREPIATIVDRASAPRLELETANIAKIVTKEMGARWPAALAELEALITKARQAGGESAIIAGRAAELALVAEEMLPRLDRATKMVAALQAKVDALEAAGREFRTTLGHAIDVLVHDRSRERAHLDGIVARRGALMRGLTEGGTAQQGDLPHGPNTLPWGNDALAAEERRVAGLVEDLTFQIATLQSQLDAKNEEHERVLVQATGSLEGSLSALRHLTNELARAIDDGVDMLGAT